MDADLAFTTLCDTAVDTAERAGAGEALGDWLESGGFIPAALERLVVADGSNAGWVRHDAIVRVASMVGMLPAGA